MSFRKRNIVVSSSGKPEASPAASKPLVPGVRPSPLDGRLTTSTGTQSLDALLAGHAGLALGTSLLIEEDGTTDFGGALLRYYAAEGVVQGHAVHVLGVDDSWSRDLPGISNLSEDAVGAAKSSPANDRMKIAWRYERLRESGSSSGREYLKSSCGACLLQLTHWIAFLEASSNVPAESEKIFCHNFDLGKRLQVPMPSPIHFVPALHQSVALSGGFGSPFLKFLVHIQSQLVSSSPDKIHRVVIPMLLSPAIYPPMSSRPEHLLQFLQALRGLLRQFSTQLTALLTLPLSLHKRSTGLTRWIELLSDGVLEFASFPADRVVPPADSNSGASTAQDEPPQGLVRVHRLPIAYEKGCGGGGLSVGSGDDMAFSLSRRKGLVLKPFSLPPVDGDTDAQQAELEISQGKVKKLDVDF